MAKQKNKEKKDYTLIGAVVFVVLIIVFGFYVLKDKKENNPMDNKIVIDMKTTCEKAWEGAEILAEIYNISSTVPTAQIIIAQCKTECQDINATYNDYKCTSADQFLCYCNKK